MSRTTEWISNEDGVLPEPLTPQDCDLRDYAWSPIDWNRLLTSETWMLGSDAEKVTALTLWGKSWHQVPAGSLPNNDRMLELLSERRDWPRVRNHAMRNWKLCSDGRLYHPVVAEKALESWKIRASQKQRTAAAREAKEAKRLESQETPAASVPAAETGSSTKPVAQSVTDAVTGSTLPDLTRPYKKNNPSDCRVEPRPADARSEIFSDGLPIVRQLTGKSERQARTLLGLFLKEARDDCPRVMATLRQAADQRPADPVSWITAALQARSANGLQTRIEAQYDGLMGWAAEIGALPE
jgi:hypothetical protein